jgi:hypothetical protein
VFQASVRNSIGHSHSFDRTLLVTGKTLRCPLLPSLPQQAAALPLLLLHPCAALSSGGTSIEGLHSKKWTGFSMNPIWSHGITG